MAFPHTELDISVLAYLGADPTQDSGTWPAPVDLSSRLADREIVITQGRRSGQDTLSSGSCSFELINTAVGDGTGDNAAGVLTPGNPASPFYNIWDLGAPMAIDVDGVGASPPYGVYRGYIASIEPRYVPGTGGADWSTVKVTLGGVARRVGRGSAPRAPLDRSLLLPNASINGGLVAYWSLSDPEGSTSASSPNASNGIVPVPAQATFGQQGPPGSAGAAKLVCTSSEDLLVFDFATVTPALVLPIPAHTGGEVAIGFWFRGSPTIETSGADGSPDSICGITNLILFSGGTLGTLEIQMQETLPGSNPIVSLVALNGSIITEINSYPDGPRIFDGAWHHVQARLVQNGADVDTEIYLDGVQYYTNTEAGQTLGVPYEIRFGTDGSVLNGSDGTFAYGVPFDVAGVTVHNDTSGFSADAIYEAGNGYIGEQAHVRIERVCDEEGVPFVSGASASQACGAQPTGDLMAIARDAETVDRGILTELVDDWGLGYVSSAERYNRSAAMTVDLSTYRTTEGTSGDVLTPVRDDQRVRNEWTISRPGGGSATVKDEAHQSKRGRFDDSASVNVETDDMLIHQAGWRVHENTYDGLRYRTMPLDLGANAADAPTDLLAAWLETSIGDRVDRTNPPAGYPDERLELVGYTQRITRKSWRVDAVVEPDDIWAVKVYASAGSNVGRWAGDTRAAIRAALTTSTTSIAFDPNTFRWGTSAPTLTAKLLPSTAAKTSGGETISITSLSTTAATYVAAGAASHANNAAVSPANYAGGAADDWVVVVGAVRTTSATLAISDANYTYTELYHQGGLYVWAAKRTGTAPAPTLTPSGGAANMTVSGQVFGLRNMPITMDLDDYVLDSVGQTNSSAANISYGRLTAAHIPGRVILVVGRKSDDWTSAAITGLTEISEATSTTGDDQSIYIAYRIDTTPTAVEAGSITVTGGASAVSDSIVLALAGGYQTATATRAQGGTAAKAHAAGTVLVVGEPLIWAL